MAADPQRNSRSNFSEMLSKDDKPAKESKNGPATQCTKQRAAIAIPRRSYRDWLLVMYCSLKTSDPREQRAF
jgi:hypothetical protein